MQIYDGKGNMFKPSRDQERLHKAGWRITERRKQGCMWIIRWVDPLPNGDKDPETGRDLHNVMSQAQAILILKERTKQ